MKTWGTKNCDTGKCETRKCGTKICGRKNARRKMVVTRRVDVLKNFFNETSDKYSGILIKYSEWCVIEHLM